MKVHQIQVLTVSPCESCGELPARMRLVVSGYSEKLCVMCIGIMSMEIGAILEQLDTEVNFEA